MFVSISYQTQRSITSNIASCTEAVLKGKNGKEQGCTRFIEMKDRDDESQRSKNSATWYTGCPNSKEPQHKNKNSKGKDIRYRAVEYLRNNHYKNGLRQNGTAKMNVCEQGDGDITDFFAENRTLVGTVKRNTQSGG